MEGTTTTGLELKNIWYGINDFVSGIRGIFGSDLTPENLSRFTAAYGSWLEGGKVVVGRDSRISGKLCEDIVVATLRSVGCTVVRAGIVPTQRLRWVYSNIKPKAGLSFRRVITPESGTHLNYSTVKVNS